MARYNTRNRSDLFKSGAVSHDDLDFNLVDEVKLVKSYATLSDLPISDVSIGQFGLIQENGSLYFYTGDGWFQVTLINQSPTFTGADATYELSLDGTPTVITLDGSDPEGVPLTWSYSITSGSLGNTAVIEQNENVFTITPSTDSADNGTFSITFTASDGVNLATGLSEFTLDIVTIVENSKYTSALITSISSTNGGTNSTVTDASSNNHSVTVNGDASAQTFSPYRSGGYSYQSNGNQKAYTTGLDLSSGDFTIECWYYYSVVEGSSAIRPVFHIGEGYPSYGVGFRRRYSNFSGIYGNSASFNLTESDYVNQWMHLAIVVTSSNSATYYVNGVSQATQSVNFSNKANLPLSILGYVDGISWDNNFYDNNGYITDLRVTNSAVYTGNFTPPTERLEAIDDTILLTANLPYLNDMTRAGSIFTKAKTFTPYDYDFYDAAVHGGSIYFDGSGDYLKTSSSSAFAFGTGDFTMEAWIYPNSVSGIQGVVSTRIDASGSTNQAFFGINNTNVFYYAGSGISGGSVSTNEWAHIACSRSGSTVRLFLNGTQVASGTDSATKSTTFGYVGAGGGNNAQLFTGYISNARVTTTAVYTSNFTPPTEPLTAITNTSLLISGADVSIADKTQKHEIYLDGNTQSSTTVTKYGSTSMYFDGSSDFIVIPSSDEFAYGTGDFTWEFWINVPGPVSNHYVIDHGANGGTISVSNNGIRYYNTTIGTGSNLYTGTTINYNTWHHVAVVRSSGTTTLYLDGTAAQSASDSHNYAAQAVSIGSYAQGSSYAFTGYLEDVRLTKGLARYTADFTPPTASLEG
jgi:hypothetical protein